METVRALVCLLLCCLSSAILHNNGGSQTTPGAAGQEQRGGVGNEPIQISALGRPFSLGMSYDSRSDTLVPGLFSLRLVDGDGRCRGRLQVQREGQNWTEVDPVFVPLALGHRVCAELHCGQAVSVEEKTVPWSEAVRLHGGCFDDTSLIRCFDSDTYSSGLSLELNCSESVQLLSGRGQLLSGRCAGSVQVKNQSWAPVCEGALDRRGAEVLCRELGCGAPLLQGALSPLEQTFYCEGHESSLMDCNQTRTTGTCSGPGLNLTCSEPLRLVDGASRCEGAVELSYSGEWRRVRAWSRWDLRAADVVCQDLLCGSAVSTEKREDFDVRAVWKVGSVCVREASVRACVSGGHRSSSGVKVVCSDLLTAPVMSVSEREWSPLEQGGVWLPLEQGGVLSPREQGRVLLSSGADFRLQCSVEPQYPGGSFRLNSPTLNTTVPAVNHSAYFLFTDAGPAHRGDYTCVYFLEVFNHNFSSSANIDIDIHPREESKTTPGPSPDRHRHSSRSDADLLQEALTYRAAGGARGDTASP